VRKNIILQRHPSIKFPHGTTIDEFLQQAAESEQKLVGVSFGYFFAEHLLTEIKGPIGLLQLGCRTIKQWDPESTETLYAALNSRARVAKEKIKGFIYYQGETDAATHANAPDFEKDLLRMIDLVRGELNDPDLPIIIVQLGRCARRGSEELKADWETVREAQRTVQSQRESVYTVSAIDLLIDDAVHISHEGQIRLGRRLAEIALSEVYQKPGHGRSIDFESMEVINPVGERPMIRVRFSGVTGQLQAEGRPNGFELRPTSSKDDEYHEVYRVDFDPNIPNAVIVGIFHPFTDDPYELIYGGGLAPYVNIVDERDMPVPAFGPIAVNIEKDVEN